MEFMNKLFTELRPFYTQKDINDAISDNKLFFFDVEYFYGFSVERDGYSKYYASIEEMIEAAYSFTKKYKRDMLATDRRIHFRAVKEVIPRTERLGNGYMLGYMDFDKADRIEIFLDKKLDFCLDDFINKHDDVVLFEEIEADEMKKVKS